jgi:hypothetical protein
MKQIIKHIIAIILLAVLLADNVLPIVSKLAGNCPVTLQDCDTEHNTKESEPTPGDALKEYFHAYTTIYCVTPVFLLSTTIHNRYPISFIQTFYLSVPTPPPDIA